MAWLPVGDPEAWKVRLKASGAIALQGAAIALSGAAMLQLKWMGAESRLANILLISLIISNLGLLLASRSDRQAIRTGQAALLCCGNFGIIAAPVPVEQAELLSAQALDMYQRMGREGGNTPSWVTGSSMPNAETSLPPWKPAFGGNAAAPVGGAAGPIRPE